MASNNTSKNSTQSSLVIDASDYIFNMRVENGVVDYEDYKRYKNYLRKRHIKAKKASRASSANNPLVLLYRLELLYVKYKTLKAKYKTTKNARTRHNMLFKLKKCFLILEKLEDKVISTPNKQVVYDFCGLEFFYKGEYYLEINDYLNSFQNFVILLSSTNLSNNKRFEEYLNEEFINVLVYNLNLLNDKQIVEEQFNDKLRQLIQNDNYKAKHMVAQITKDSSTVLGTLEFYGQTMQIYDQKLFRDLKALQSCYDQLDCSKYEELQKNIAGLRNKTMVIFVEYHLLRLRALKVLDKLSLNKLLSKDNSAEELAILAKTDVEACLLELDNLNTKAANSLGKDVLEGEMYEEGCSTLKECIYVMLLLLTVLYYYNIDTKDHKSVLSLCDNLLQELTKTNKALSCIPNPNHEKMLLEQSHVDQIERITQAVRLETTIQHAYHKASANNIRLLQHCYIDTASNRNKFVNLTDIQKHQKLTSNAKRTPYFEMIDVSPIVFDVASNILDLTDESNEVLQHLSALPASKLNNNDPSTGFKGIIKSLFG